MSTHNVNGYKTSKEFLYSRCEDETHAIFAIQEHWLKPAVRRQQGVNLLKSLHPKYDGYGTSAMTSKMNSEILKGRPFGGTGFLYSKNLSLSLRPLPQYSHERVSVMELSTTQGQILLINAYLPFYDTRNLDSQVTLYKDTVAYIENIMRSHVNSHFILLMDINCNVYNTNHVYTRVIRDLMANNDLITTFDLIPNFDASSQFTRCDVKTGSFTLIDNILISKSLESIVENVSISHVGNNVSDHSPIDMKVTVELELFPEQKMIKSEYIPWASLSECELTQFHDTMECKLRAINVPFHSILHGSHSCNDIHHLNEIECYYNMIIDAIQAADATLPRKKSGIAKHFWSRDLSSLKQKSIDAFNLWKISGCPNNGPIHSEKNSAHLQYKRALRKAKNENDSALSDSLCYDFHATNPEKFWKNWNKITAKETEVSCVDGQVDHGGIANAFAKTFSDVYKCSDTPAESNLRSKFNDLYTAYEAKHHTESIQPFFISWSEFLLCLSNVSTGKATGGFVKPQHLLHGSPLLSLHLHLLFNAFIQHSYVPQEFLCTVVSPVVKDTSGDYSDSTNYRPITLSSFFSQLFERAIKIKIGHLLETDNLQFGFKPKHSTTHALFTLNETVSYFTKHGSTVLTSFLDCSKAFDKLSHAGLFIKLIERNVPLCFIDLLIYWLSNLSSRCRWRGILSDPYSVTSGIKQGGILSPDLFNIYVDDLLKLLREAGVGCHIDNQFYGAIMFADDLALIAPTRSALQKLINICENYCNDHCLRFNARKTKTMVFGKGFDTAQVSPLILNNEPIQFVSEWKYLGCLIVSGKTLSYSARNDLSSFRRSVNSILSAVKKPGEPVLMRLLYSFSVPILTYASEVKLYSHADMTACSIALNDAIRKIFSFHRWESIRTLRQDMGYLDLITIFAQSKRRFFAKMQSLANDSLSSLLFLNLT